MTPLKMCINLIVSEGPGLALGSGILPLIAGPSSPMRGLLDAS